MRKTEMRTWRAVAASLLFFSFILLTTCQLQFNNSAGNVALRIVLPGNSSGGAKAILAGARYLAGGASLTVTITQEGTSFSAQQTVSLNGQTSVDISFSLSSNGVYDVLAVMEDAVGDILSQTTTKLTVPAGNYPVVLPMYSSLLSNAVFTGTDNYLAPPTFAFVPTFSMTTFTYSGIVPEPNYQFPPYALTLTTVDPQATITSVTVNGTPVSPSGTTYALPSLLLLSTNTIIIVVTAADGGTHTYTMTFLYNAG